MRIIIAPQTETSEAVLERLVSWSASGLVEPFSWWWAGVPDGSSELEVQRLADGEVEPQSLSDALGDDAHPDDIALIAVYPAARGESIDMAFVDQVDDRLETAKPVLMPGSARPMMPAMVVIPGAVAQTVPGGLFRSRWAANLYVAPEDRDDPQAPNRLPDHDEDFPGHAAHAVATLADLWTWPLLPGETVLSKLSPQQATAQRAPVTVVRCFTRGVDYGHLPGHLAANLFQPAGAWPNPDLKRFDRVRDSVALTTYLVTRFMEKHQEALGLSKFVPFTVPPPRQLTLLQGLRELFTQIGKFLRNAPVEIVVETVNGIHNRFAGAVERLSKQDEWRIKRRGGIGPIDGMRELRERMDRPFQVADGPVEAAWTELRTMSFGLIDGADLPEDVDRDTFQKGEKRLVVTDANRIVPDPVRRPPESPAVPDPPRACDPLNLDPRFEVLAATLAAEKSAAKGSATEEERAPIDREEWSEGLTATVLWQVGAAIATAIEKAVAQGAPLDEERAAKEREAAAEAAKNAEKAARTERRVAIAVFVIVTLLVVVAWYFSWTELAIVALVAATIGSLALWIFVMGLLAKWLIGRRERAWLERLRREVNALNAAYLRAQRWGDKYRLQRRYEEYLDWAEIVGWMAHHPWIGEPLKRVNVQSSVDQATLPAAFSIAIARTREQLDRVTSRARVKVFNKSWLNGLYTTVDAKIGKEHNLAIGAEETVPLPSAAADTDDDELSVRRRLLAAIRDGEGRRLQSSAMAKDLLKFVGGIRLDDASQGVLDLDEAAITKDESTEPLPPATAWLSAPPDLPALAAMLRPSVVRVRTASKDEHSGGTGVALSTTGLIATARHVVEGGHTFSVEFDGGAPVEAKLVGMADATDLALLSVADHPVEHVATLAAGGPLRQGDPVISLGHPHLLDGDPTLAWGIVTAVERRITLKDDVHGIGEFRTIQATLQSAGGASGSPVFDMTGQVVGILVAGGDRDGAGKARELAEYMTSLVPADDLQQLITTSHTEAAPEPGTGLPPFRTSAEAGSKDAGEFPSATDFLHEIMHSPPDVSLLHQHWSELRHTPQRVKDVIASQSATVDAPMLGQVSGSIAFLTPVRVLSSRVDVAGGTDPGEIAGCDDADQLLPDEEDNEW